MTEDLDSQTRVHRPYSEALFLSLSDDPFYRTLKARSVNSAGAREAMLRYFDYSIFEAAQFGHLCQLPEERAGVSLWSVPLPDVDQQRKSHDKKQFIRDHMGQEALTTYEQIGAFMASASNHVVDPTDWYLSILGVHPKFQGQGRGGDLVRPVLGLTDQTGVASYLETFTPRNMPFYERLGFRKIASFSEPVTGSDYWVMRRSPE